MTEQLRPRPGRVIETGIPGLIIAPQNLPPTNLLRRSNFSRDPNVSAILRRDQLDRGNREGFESEWRVGRLLGKLHYVARVIQSRPGSPKDKDMTDLTAKMVQGYPIPDLKVQVKKRRPLGNTLSRRFSKIVEEKDPSLKEIKSEEERRRRKKEEKLRERRIFLYTHREVDGKIIPVTDEELLASFSGQLDEIVEFYRSQRPAA